MGGVGGLPCTLSAGRLPLLRFFDQGLISQPSLICAVDRLFGADMCRLGLKKRDNNIFDKYVAGWVVLPEGKCGEEK